VSFLTTVIVIVPMVPEALEARLLNERADGETLLRRMQFGPHGFAPILHVYGATFSHFADSEFMDWLSNLPWEWPGGWKYRDQVRVIAHHEYSDIAPLIFRLTADGWENA
jgi:hypothetical protein